MQRALKRPQEIDSALRSLGYDPEECGFDRLRVH
jgi:hypothetical protein